MNTKGNGKNVGNKENVSSSTSVVSMRVLRESETFAIKLDTRRQIIRSLKLEKKVNVLC